MSREVIKITKAACQKLSQISKEQNTMNILFYVKGGGCNGFNYKLEPLEGEPEKGDELVRRDSYNLYVCNKSLMHVLGTTIDWKRDIMGETFHFDNPMAQAKCGCGTSFTPKVS